MSPHMTGRSEPESAADHLSASDLLGEDGTVDQSAVKSIANGGADRADRVQASESDTIRRQLLTGATTTTALAEDLGYDPRTVRAHAKGKHDYPRDETPDLPPLQYGPGGWVVVDGE